MTTIQVKKISLQEAKDHSRSNYNSREWSKIIDLYAKDEAEFYTNDSDKVYAVYMADGIRFFKELSYSMGLTSSGFQMGIRGDNTITLMRFPDNKAIDNTPGNRKILSNNCKENQMIFYYN
ncbi:hypothetical protein elemo19C_phanotate45 [Flavobacterium phage vB_FspP_elemoA_1-9C]|jgi:hypothetical protein|uniref:Uncharacterized protein n=2 Tax=Elemovirus TaxID=2948694 RepID=A0A7D7JRX1_9CAUD|nr:hypothetical protein KNV10_gp66 [Flavobacterium phage vB_FspP_elemoA_7-9A]YP_010109038.1 hypothetical protein KNV12_gp63 [Flavobacterium phage vB_FspP_elemoE_6-9C]QMP84664.1 hypothetical protein elemo131A_phanotate45 [Flavobacterium phage vB_FspP_elemoA_13-1A]QMP85027.1 hypothetical protein elemo159B_phanotate44 [Flavobacterium phage vB_FspP_elemoA_15-9B]QMP85117.1 hypothetical protein elemo25C_phanotate45 [Flavobacterium phage vB_FspP_elemoA_2-5C]QMP85475.1 hypothetical protein elemo15B_ph